VYKSVRVTYYILVPTPGTPDGEPETSRKRKPSVDRKSSKPPKLSHASIRRGTYPSKPTRKSRAQPYHEGNNPAEQRNTTFSWTACSHDELNQSCCHDRPAQTFYGVSPASEAFHSSTIQSLGLPDEMPDINNLHSHRHRIHDVNYFGRDDAILFILNRHAPHLSTFYQCFSTRCKTSHSTTAISSLQSTMQINEVIKKSNS